MKFKVDENLPVEVGNLFKENRFEASTVLEQGLGGKADSYIAEVCKKERLPW
jgi:predicted nuclease of predicted toxin-antitoxin system